MAGHKSDGWDIWAQLASICEPMQVPQAPPAARSEYNLPQRNTRPSFNGPAPQENTQQRRSEAFPPSNGQHHRHHPVEDVLEQRLQDTPAYPRLSTYGAPKQYGLPYSSQRQVGFAPSQPSSSRMSNPSPALESASLPFPKSLQMDGSYRDMYKEVNANLFTPNYSSNPPLRSPPPEHPRGSKNIDILRSARPEFPGVQNTTDSDLWTGASSNHLQSISLSDVAGQSEHGDAGRTFETTGVQASPPDNAFGSSSHLMAPEPFQRKGSMPKVLATQPVSAQHAAGPRPSSSETSKVCFYLVRGDAGSVDPTLSRPASLPFRTEAAIVRGDHPSPPAWVQPELAEQLRNRRFKSEAGWVQSLQDGTQVPLPEEFSFAVGSAGQHRIVRTRLPWPVPITIVEEHVLVSGVRAYVSQHQTLPASISELLAYCD